MTPSQPPLVTRQRNFGSRATTSIDFALGRFVKKRLREPRASSRNQAPVAGCENLSRRFPTVRMYFESSEFRSKALIGSISHKRAYRNAKPCHAGSQAGLFADDDFGINRQGAESRPATAPKPKRRFQCTRCHRAGDRRAPRRWTRVPGRPRQAGMPIFRERAGPAPSFHWWLAARIASIIHRRRG